MIIRASLSESKYIKSKRFEALKEFFPEVADDRIALVEEFHSDIAKILTSEIRASEKELIAESERIGASDLLKAPEAGRLTYLKI